MVKKKAQTMAWVSLGRRTGEKVHLLAKLMFSNFVGLHAGPRPLAKG